MKTAWGLGFGLGVALLGAGCVAEVVDPEGELGLAEQALVCADVANTDVGRSLVVTDPVVLAKFAFTRTMNRIRTTASVKSTETSTGIYQRWMRTFGSTPNPGDCNDARVDPEGYGIVCPRAPDLKLSTVNPMAATSSVKFEPVGVFNRFDLAPSNGANCGEYRIVYAMNSTHPNIGGRAFIIFEATMPNPTPAQGIEACFPVAQFWQSLTADTDATSRANKLEKFYFTGGAVTGFPAVVDAAHYGLSTNGAAHPVGQVRTNFFVDFVEWHLREFKLARSCTSATDPQTCTLAFEHVTVKTNPAEELFAGTHTRSAAFRTSLITQVPKLANANVNLIAMTINNAHNEFESISQATNVLYRSVANATIRGQIQTKLTAIGSALTVNNILNRATTQTCAGCHQVSNGQALGGGITWPNSAGFVHIDESSALSPALTGTFLPRRKQVLEKFINDRCDGVSTPVAEGFTISGAPEGAPN